MAEISTPEIVNRRLRKLKRQGAHRQDPSGIKIERKGEAQMMVQFGAFKLSLCCIPKTPGDRPTSFSPKSNQKELEDMPPSGGIRVAVMVSFRGHPGNPLEDLSVFWLDRSGELGSGADWALPKQD